MASPPSSGKWGGPPARQFSLSDFGSDVFAEIARELYPRRDDAFVRAVPRMLEHFLLVIDLHGDDGRKTSLHKGVARVRKKSGVTTSAKAHGEFCELFAKALPLMQQRDLIEEVPKRSAEHLPLRTTRLGHAAAVEVARAEPDVAESIMRFRASRGNSISTVEEKSLGRLFDWIDRADCPPYVQCDNKVWEDALSGQGLFIKKSERLRRIMANSGIQYSGWDGAVPLRYVETMRYWFRNKSGSKKRSSREPVLELHEIDIGHLKRKLRDEGAASVEAGLLFLRGYAVKYLGRVPDGRHRFEFTTCTGGDTWRTIEIRVGGEFLLEPRLLLEYELGLAGVVHVENGKPLLFVFCTVIDETLADFLVDHDGVATLSRQVGLSAGEEPDECLRFFVDSQDGVPQ